MDRNAILEVVTLPLVAFSPMIALAVVAYFLLSPSAPSERVVLLPGPDGKVGRVLVKSTRGEQELSEAYAGIAANVEGNLTSEASVADDIQKRYGQTLEARPLRPQSFVVYFASGSATELDAASLPVLDELKAALATRPSAEITVIGHTDTVGELEANDVLSAQRAATMRLQLVSAGIDAVSIDVAGRGERELLIKTSDDVDQPKNRRVEINVR